MSDYAIANLKEIDDSAGEYAPDLEAHSARKHLGSEHLGVSYFRYGPGFRAPMGHRHREQEEVYVVINGSGRIRINDEILSAGPVGRRPRRTEGAARAGGRRGRPRDHRDRLRPPGRRRRGSRKELVGRLSPGRGSRPKRDCSAVLSRAGSHLHV